VDIRYDLLTFFQAAVKTVEGKQVVEQALPDVLQTLEKDSSCTDRLAEIKDMQIVAIGKAAESMLQGALCYLGNTSNQALLISKLGHISPEPYQNPSITCIESAHPVPDKSSLKAGDALIQFLQSSQAPCLFLISGGTSSLVEVLDDNWSLDELQDVTQWMLANAYSIDQMNSVRSRISKIKAGGLWKYLMHRKVICLMISDVASDDPHVIGSGLLFANKQNTKADTLPSSLPSHWKQKLSVSLPIKPPTSFYWQIISSNQQARQASANAAKQKGYQVKVIAELQQGLAEEVAKQCVLEAKKHPNTVIIWGAETTVLLPEKPGVGGRNQHLALAAAIALQGDHHSFLLSAGTDGTDGNSDDTGAIVDGQTLERAIMEGGLKEVDAEKSLQQADSGNFLNTSGDLISTGVTGTNVMDLIIAYITTDSSL